MKDNNYAARMIVITETTYWGQRGKTESKSICCIRRRSVTIINNEKQYAGYLEQML